MKTFSTLHTKSKMLERKAVGLSDVLDKVVDKGVFLTGEATMNMADIDLVFLGIKLLLAPTRKIKRHQSFDGGRNKVRPDEISRLQKKLEEVELNLPKVIKQGGKNEEQGIAKLVLTLVVLIKNLMEKEAIRKIDAGGLSRKQIEKLGLSFRLLDRKIEELKAVFGIKDELNLDLGPLGKLI